MPQNKKHHYVPRFYLKRFSPDGNSINIWNLPNQKKVLSANLKNQCYKDYFYGKELEVEAALAKIEGEASRILRRVDQLGAPPAVGSGSHLILILYVLMQHGRTAYAADTLNEMNDKMVKHIFGADAKSKGIDLEKITIGIKDVSRYSLSLTTQMYPMLLDMECRLLVNHSSVEFVTSDNPVVLYNQLFSFRRFASNTGWASKGLQIFLPIGPHATLLFFDPDVYGVGSNTSSVVSLHHDKDIYQLNTLQACSAAKNIYFSSSALNIEALSNKALQFRRKQKSNLDVFPKSEGKNRSHLISTSREDVRTNLSLSFLRLTKGAKQWQAEFRKKRFQPAAVVRNERLCRDHDEFLKRVDKQEYLPSDFFKFMEDKYDKTGPGSRKQTGSD